MNESLINTLILKMTEYYMGDAKRIQHFIKVYTFSKMIGEMEQLRERQLLILELAAVVHDIGIRAAEEQYGSSMGKYQEMLGPDLAKDMLAEIQKEYPDSELDNEMIDRICYLIGHHHTYNNIDGWDYQILVEADFIVNIYEDGLDKQSAEVTYKKIFRTKAGKQLLNNIFALGR